MNKFNVGVVEFMGMLLIVMAFAFAFWYGVVWLFCWAFSIEFSIKYVIGVWVTMIIFQSFIRGRK